MPNKANAHIDVQDISFGYKNGSKFIPVLKDISFKVGKGSFVSIVGPSGCGKTTLLKLLSGLLSTDSGMIIINGDHPDEARKKRSIGYVFQQPVLLEWRTVRQNVELPGELFRDKTVLEKVDQYLDLVGLGHVADYFPQALSGGMQSRVAIARALIHQPDILLLDEPFADLDEINRESMNLELLRLWKETGTTIVFVSHNLEEAIFLSDTVYVLSSGPASVFKVSHINIERPRNLDLISSSAFGESLKEIRKALRMVHKTNDRIDV